MSANRWPKGRKIPGSGRKKGSPSKPKRDRLLDRAKRYGLRVLLPDVGVDPETSPLEFLEAVMRRGDLPVEVRMHAARAAAPYRHPALRSVDFKGSMTIGISAALHEFIAGNTRASRSFIDFDGEDRDSEEAPNGRSLPHH
jgi:hypothetical protein